MAVLINGHEFFFLLTSLDGMFFSMELDSVVLKVSHMLSTSLGEISLGDSLLASSWSSVSMSSEMVPKFAFFHKNTRRGAAGSVLFNGFARHSISTVMIAYTGFDVDMLNQRFVISEEMV